MIGFWGSVRYSIEYLDLTYYEIWSLHNKEITQKPTPSLLLILPIKPMKLIQLEHILRTSQKRGHPHVYPLLLLRQHVQYPPHPRAPRSAGLLHDHGHGSRFVEEAQPPLLVVGGGGIAVDAAVDEDVVDVGHHGADVACGYGLSAGNVWGVAKNNNKNNELCEEFLLCSIYLHIG